jgi:hypothetical protein
MSAHAPLDRLAPRDFYRQIDLVRDNWQGDERAMSKRIMRLRQMFAHLPISYFQRAQPLIAEVAVARVAEGRQWQDALRGLAAIVTDWNRDRPPLLECPECGLLVRGHRRLLNHRLSVHGIEEAA